MKRVLTFLKWDWYVFASSFIGVPAAYALLAHLKIIKYNGNILICVFIGVVAAYLFSRLHDPPMPYGPPCVLLLGEKLRRMGTRSSGSSPQICNPVQRVLGSCEFQWCGFHSCAFSKNSPNIHLMQFSLHK